jgi:hypothetical protein
LKFGVGLRITSGIRFVTGLKPGLQHREVRLRAAFADCWHPFVRVRLPFRRLAAGERTPRIAPPPGAQSAKADFVSL